MRAKFFYFLSGIIVLLLFHSVPTVALTPEENVTKLHQALITIMKKAKTDTPLERYDFLAPILEDLFDFDTMIKTASGIAWKKANAKERGNLRKAFAKISTATYVTRFPSYNEHSFQFVKAESGPRKTILVNTLLDTPKIKPFPLTYVTIEKNGKWRIIDVILDKGISELAVRRSEYRAIFKKGGIAALLDALSKKATALLGG
ncbi:MAG: hypothetical protein CFH06_00459 [Alphaproteobacteria bacterium MarineAlpha3_Bin5]|nr:hypothetical protein [Magnetovibrio sp.]PPR79242.1 MAG: hypothetical protein CFH06_00459 [Alphaproteobacteria bacterium MarineAlpha3_Bin5]